MRTLCAILCSAALLLCCKHIDNVKSKPAVDEVFTPCEIQTVEMPEQEEPEYEEMEVIATAYCPCKECCGKTDRITATGAKATAGRTIAVDPKVIPYGTKIIINGNEYVAEDCGGAIKGNRIDIFFNTHEEALQFGRQELTIKAYMVK